MENATVIAKCGVVVLKTPLADFLALVMEKSYGFYQGSLLCLNNFTLFLPYMYLIFCTENVPIFKKKKYFHH